MNLTSGRHPFLGLLTSAMLFLAAFSCPSEDASAARKDAAPERSSGDRHLAQGLSVEMSVRPAAASGPADVYEGEDWVGSADRMRLYVTMPRAGRVAVVDTDSFKIVANVEAGSYPVRVALQPDRRYVRVGNGAPPFFPDDPRANASASGGPPK